MQVESPLRALFDSSIFVDWDMEGQIRSALDTPFIYKEEEDRFVGLVAASIRSLNIPAIRPLDPYYVMDKKILDNPLKLFYFPSEAQILAPLKSKLGHKRAAGGHKIGCQALLFQLREKKIEKVWQQVNKKAAASRDFSKMNIEALLTKQFGQQPYWPKVHFPMHRILYSKDIITNGEKECILKECTVFDYYPLDMKFASKTSAKLPDLLLLKMVLGVLQALEFLHKNDIVHGDVKLENILVGKDRTLLTDYDQANNASLKPRAKEYYYLTKMYTSPERLEYNASSPESNKAADLYALGVSLARCSSFAVPWIELFRREEDKKDILLLQKSLKIHSEIALESINKSCESAIFTNKLIQALLHPLPEKRITAAKAVRAITEKKYTLPLDLLAAIEKHKISTHLDITFE